MNLTLKALEGQILEQPVPLPSGEVLIGRSRSCAVRVAALDVSGKHCVLKISGEAVAVENLSANGTLLDGSPVEFITLIRPGQVLQLGASTRLRLEVIDDVEAPTRPAASAAPVRNDAADGQTQPTSFGAMDDLPTGAKTPSPVGPPSPPPAPPADEEETGKGRAVFPTPSSPPPPSRPAATFRAPPPPPSAAEEDIIEATQGAYEQTRAMETRVLRPEDIDALREKERAKPRKRMILLALGGIALLVAAFLLWPESKPPETVFSWPVDAKGDYINAEVDSPTRGGYDKGGFFLGFPGSPGWKQESPSPDTLRITTYISRDLNVPLVLILTDEKDPRFLRQGLEQAMRAWMEEMRERNTGWFFDAPSETIFLGEENGIPFKTVSYAHQENGAWHGVARLFVYQDARIILRTEVPYPERVRAGPLINLKYIIVSPAFERAFWPGDSQEPPTDLDGLLRRARAELQRNAPSIWSGLEQLIFQACRRAALDNRAAERAEAESLLAQLREKQRVWFNAQKIAREEAWLGNQEARMRQIAELCKGVFPHPGDLRHFIVRREEW